LFEWENSLKKTDFYSWATGQVLMAEFSREYFNVNFQTWFLAPFSKTPKAISAIFLITLQLNHTFNYTNFPFSHYQEK
jgi:hypothetical protein